MVLSKIQRRQRVKSRIRKVVKGTTEQPRLAVFGSNNEIYVQVIGDAKGTTLLAAPSHNRKLGAVSGTKVEKVAMMGEAITEKALKQGIEKIPFDRGGCLYHRRVKSLARGAREDGLKF